MPSYPVYITFDDGFSFQEAQFNINAILLSGLTVTSNPEKMVYRSGELISYSGLTVIATYSDESPLTLQAGVPSLHRKTLCLTIILTL